MGEWITTKIPLELSKHIDSFLNSEDGKIFPNKMQFISEALREKLEKNSSIKPQLDRLEKNLEFLTEKLVYDEKRKKLENLGYLPPSSIKSENDSLPSPTKQARKIRKEIKNKLKEKSVTQ
jgi:hypothetical protein